MNANLFFNTMRMIKCSIAASVCILVSSSFVPSGKMSLIGNSVRYSDPQSSQWSEWTTCSLPVFLNGNQIIFGSVPKAVFNIIERKGQAADGTVAYKCKNAKGTEFNVKMQFSSDTEGIITVENTKGKMAYKCSVLKTKPYCYMVDLGLSCKWGLANYSPQATDAVSAAYGSGSLLAYDDAMKIFRGGKQHLPSTRQIRELLTSCSWEFIENPEIEFYKGYLVTGPNGNSIFLPCNDGGKGNFSSGWYLGSEEVDPFLANALQLNVNSRIVYPFERQYYGNVRLVEEK